MVWVDLYQREGIIRPKNKINDCLKTFFHLNIFVIVCPIHTQAYQRDSQKGREDKNFSRVGVSMVRFYSKFVRQINIAPWLNLNINCHLPVKTEQDNGDTRNI